MVIIDKYPVSTHI